MSGPLERLAGRIEVGLDGRPTPVVAGVVTGLLFWWLAGSLAPVPWVYDEAAYLLQSKIFAAGQWAAAGRPLPEFFEQIHVFATPRLVPKYPPGHALLLVPGIWAGAPWLMPLLFTAVTGALVFGFARALLGAWAGLLTWLIWVTSPEELYIRPSYLSQVSTTLVWLGGWWAFERWRVTRRRGPLVGLAVLAAIGVLTRPITAFAFLLPIGVVVLREAWRHRLGGQVIAALAVAAPVLGVAAWWSYASSGRVFPTPYSEYSRVYAPWNMPGFAVDRSPPLRAEIPAIARFRTEWIPIHERHTIGRLPMIAVERLGGIGITFFGDGGFPGTRYPLRWLLLVGLIAGLAGMPRALGVVVLSGGVLFVAMLWLASRPLWTVYYLEVFPALAGVTALGCWRLAEWAARRTGRPIAPILVLAGIVVAVPGVVERLIRAKQQQEDVRLVPTDLARRVAGIEGRAVVFVASGPPHRPFESYVTNEPDLDQARVWIVHDRGDDNARLLALAPDRRAYRFDPGTGALAPLGRP
ncbi:MAG: ArnT family glycosyltransferase [Gemmatimonadales bacterium]